MISSDRPVTPPIGGQSAVDASRGYLVPLLGAFLVSFLLYANTIPGRFVFDDRIFVDRPELRTAGGIVQNWREPLLWQGNDIGVWRPLTITSFGLNFLSAGESPASFHITNILINGLVTFLVFVVAAELFGSQPLAYFTALAFALFPIHSNVVAHIKARDDLLSTLFILLAWLSFLKAVAAAGRRRALLLVTSSSLYLLAIFSKELALFAPALFLATHWARNRASVRSLFHLGAAFVPTVPLYLAVRWQVFSSRLTFGAGDQFFVVDRLLDADWPAKFWTPFKVALYAIGKTFVPVNLSATYRYNHFKLVSGPLHWEVLAGVLLLVLLIGLLWWRRTRGTPLGVGAAAFLVSYAPFSKFIVQGSDIFAERWLYLPSVGLAMVAAAILVWLCRWRRWLALGLAALVAVAYSSVVIPRNTVWLTPETLARSMVKDAPDSIQGYTGMAIYHIGRGEFNAARPYVAQARRIYDRDQNLLLLRAQLAFHDGDYQMVRQLALQAFEEGPNLADPTLRALVLAIGGNYGEVIVFIAQNRHLASIAARDPTVRFILALSYYRLGDEIATGRYLDWDPGKTTEEELKILQEF